MSEEDIRHASPEQIGFGRLFSGERQFENFARMQDRLRVTRMAPSSRPFAFDEGARMSLPAIYRQDGQPKSLAALIDETDTTALLVIKDGTVRYEDYRLSGGRDVQWLSMSVAKSFVSALVGIAHSEGAISSLEAPIDRYVPTLAGSAYAGVRILDVLQMSSGARWNEDYSDPDSEIFRLAAALAPGGSYDAFMASMPRACSPGTLCQYNSADTQALAMLVRGATGRSLTSYMEEKICEPLGMEAPSFWVADSHGVEMAFAGLLMTARDFAKLGELYRNGGMWQGRRIVPADYVRASVVHGAPHLAPGKPLVGGHAFPMGYGYQWWLPDGGCGEFSAIGIYNQFVYVDPSRDTVIVKLSANPHYGLSHDDADNRDWENILGLRAIAEAFDEVA